MMNPLSKREYKYFHYSLSLPYFNSYQKLNNQYNLTKILNKKKFIKKNCISSTYLYQNNWNIYRNKQAKERKTLNKKFSVFKNKFDDDDYNSKNKKIFQKKISLDTKEDSTLEIEYNENSNSELLTNDNSNSSQNTIFFEEFKKSSKDILKKQDEIINNKENNLNKKSSYTNINKFNIKNYNDLINQNKIKENTEILSINVKLSNTQTSIFKLRRFDNLFITVKLFCEINNIKETLIKPIIIIILKALNNVYKIYNTSLNKKDIIQLQKIKEICN